MKEEFVAQSLVETKIVADQRRFEMTFVDAEGCRQTISLSARVAAELAAVVASLDANLRNGDQPTLTKIPKQCAVGRAQHERLVLLRFDDDPPYALELDNATHLWRDVREEAEKVSRMSAPTRQ